MVQEFLEKTLVPLMRILLKLFFREIQVVNIENVPENGPVIYTPNHPNSIIDGMLARAFLPRDPRALAKATLWNNPITRPLVVATNSIPVNRQMDAKSPDKPVDNSDMFQNCTKALAEKSAIVLFPEGVSHDDPTLKPIKTGAARIALSARKEHDNINVQVVPVGLIFDDKKKFRSRVLIFIGKPFNPTEGIKTPDAENRELVSNVTDRIEKGIKSVTLNYPSWKEANNLQRAASLYLSIKKRELGTEQSLVDTFSLHKQVADTYQDMKQKNPRKVNRVIHAVNSYDRLLRVLGIQHEHFMQDRPGIIQTISNLQKVSLFLVRLPLAMLGIFLNALPYLLVRAIGNFRNMPENRTSTVMLFAAFFVCPLLWTVEANILGYGLLPVWFWWLMAPISGIASIYFLEHYSQMLEEMTTYIRLQSKSEIREEIEERLVTLEREVGEYFEASQSLNKQLTTSRQTAAAMARVEKQPVSTTPEKTTPEKKTPPKNPRAKPPAKKTPAKKPAAKPPAKKSPAKKPAAKPAAKRTPAKAKKKGPPANS